MMKRMWDFWFRSVFRRMYVIYAVIIIASTAFLGITLAGNMADLIVSQSMEYNAQQLSSLHSVFQSQVAILHYIRGKLYEAKTSTQATLFDSLKIVLRDDKPFATLQDYDEFIAHANNIHTFFNLAQSSLQTEMSLFQIKGLDANSGNINILWPISNQGMIQYADEIYAKIAAQKTGSQRGMLPFISAEGERYERRFYVLYESIYDASDRSTDIGLLINGYQTNTLDEVFDRFSYPLEGAAFVLNQNGEVLYDTSGEHYGSIPDFFTDIAKAHSASISKGQYVYNVIHSDADGYYIVGKIDQQVLRAKAMENNRTILLLSFVCAFGAILISFLATQVITRRIRGIRQAMSAAQTGDLSVSIPLSRHGDEMDEIAHSFNSMVRELDNHIQAEYVNELQRTNALVRQREAEFFALQSQVNPHFLYNTLEIIRMQAITNGDEDTALLIRWLASLFRRRTHTGIVVTLAQEIEYCQALMEILRAKFNGEIDVVIDIPEDILQYAILKDLIQPPLENAFIHGFQAGEDQERLLVITGRMAKGDIILSVYNNGHVIPVDILKTIQSRLDAAVPLKSQEEKHVGLINVHHRIRLAYGSGYGIRVESTEAHGTTVTMTIQALSTEALSERIAIRQQSTEA